MKKLFAAMMILLSVAMVGCSISGTGPTTEPVAKEQAPVISKVQWMIDQYVDEVSCQYDGASNTLKITGEDVYPVEVQFYEESAYVRKQTVWDPDGQIYTQKEYDEQGDLIYELDDYGRQRYYERADGLLLRETAYENGSDLVSTKEWTYDDAGRDIACFEETDGGNETVTVSKTYDGDGNMTQYRMDSTYGDESWYQLDTYTYEGGRMVASRHQKDDPANCWDYTVTYRYDDQGNKTHALRHDDTFGSAEDLWVYDGNGRVIRSVEHYLADGWVEVVYEYTYDEQGNPLREGFTEWDPSSGERYCQDEALYTYDDAGRLIRKIFNNVDDAQYVHRYEYDEQGNLTAHSFGTGEETDRLTFEYHGSKLVQINLNGTERLRGEDIQVISEENVADRYIAADYGNTADADRADVVNTFILEYIQLHY